MSDDLENKKDMAEDSEHLDAADLAGAPAQASGPDASGIPPWQADADNNDTPQAVATPRKLFGRAVSAPVETGPAEDMPSVPKPRRIFGKSSASRESGPKTLGELYDASRPAWKGKKGSGVFRKKIDDDAGAIPTSDRAACCCHNILSNVLLGLRVVGSEIKWAWLAAMAGWENRQLRRRLRKEETDLGRCFFAQADKLESLEEGSKVEVDVKLRLMFKQVQFLHNEIRAAEEDLRRRREEFVAERKARYHCNESENKDA